MLTSGMKGLKSVVLANYLTPLLNNGQNYKGITKHGKNEVNYNLNYYDVS